MELRICRYPRALKAITGSPTFKEGSNNRDATYSDGTYLMFQKPSMLVSLSNADFSDRKDYELAQCCRDREKRGLTHTTEGSSSTHWPLRAGVAQTCEVGGLDGGRGCKGHELLKSLNYWAPSKIWKL